MNLKKTTAWLTRWMPDPATQCFAALCLLSTIWIVLGIFQGELLAGDETRVAGIAAEMCNTGDWIVPRLNGKPFLEYPPLYYQLTAVSFRLFGYTDAAAGIPSVLAALGCVFLLFFLLRACGRLPVEALLSSVFLMTSAHFFIEARTCRVDILLTFFVTLAVFGFIRWFSSKRFSGLILLVLGVAGGIMTKGLIGAVIPAAGIGSFLVADDLLNKRFSLSRYLKVFCSFLLALLPLILYSILLWRQCGEEAVYEMDYVNGIGRFSGSQGDHVLPWYWYLARLPGQFAPWLILTFAGMYCAILRIYRERKLKDTDVLLFLLVIPFILLSCAAGKRQVYLLPLAPCCAFFAIDGVNWLLSFRKTSFLQSYLTIKNILLLLLAAGIITNIANILFTRHRAKEDSLRILFAEAEKTAKAEKRVLKLYHPAERLSGAAYFYRRQLTPVVGQVSAHDLQELWVARRPDFKHSGKEYADTYFLIRYPEEVIVPFEKEKK